MVRTAVLLVEGLGLCMAVVAIGRTSDVFVPRLVLMTLAGATAAALLTITSAASELIGSGDWPSGLVDVLLRRRWTVHVGDINAAGSYFAMLLPVAAGVASTCRGRHRLWLLPGGLAIGLALWMTGSRAAQVGLLAVLFLLVISRLVVTRSPRERSLMLGTVVLVPAAAIAVTLWLSGGPARITPERGFVQMNVTEAVKDRLLFARGSVEMWASRPVFGVGIGQYSLWSAHYFPPALLQRHLRENAHNYVLQVFAELGAVGLVLFLWALGLATRPLARVALRDSFDPLRLGLVAGLGAFMVSTLGGQPFLVAPVVYSFWLLLGVAATSHHTPTALDTGTSASWRPALASPDRATTPGTFAVAPHTRVWVLGLTVVLGPCRPGSQVKSTGST